MYSSEGLNDWQVCDQDGLKGDYIMKKIPYGRGIEEKLRGKRKKIIVASTFINNEVNNNSSHQTMISSSFISISMLVYSRDPY